MTRNAHTHTYYVHTHNTHSLTTHITLHYTTPDYTNTTHEARGKARTREIGDGGGEDGEGAVGGEVGLVGEDELRTEVEVGVVEVEFGAELGEMAECARYALRLRQIHHIADHAHTLQMPQEPVPHAPSCVCPFHQSRQIHQPRVCQRVSVCCVSM
jgi:hypothetical protein